MKINSLILPVIALCLTAVSSHAAITLTINDDRPAASPVSGRAVTTSLGTFGTNTTTLPNFTYVINNLNLSSLTGGGFSDSITIRLAFTNPGSGTIATNTFGAVGVGSPLQLSGTERLVITPTIQSVSSGLAISNFSVNLTQIRLADFGGTDALTITNSGTTQSRGPSGAGGEFIDFAASNTFAGIVPGAGDGATFRGSRLVVTIIPEPSSALLGCIGILCLLRRRRA